MPADESLFPPSPHHLYMPTLAVARMYAEDGAHAHNAAPCESGVE